MKKAVLILVFLFAGMAELAAQDTTGKLAASNEDAFVPLSDLRPIETPEGHREKHSFQYGVSASNTFITDKAGLSKGYWLGNYRPYLKYYFHEQHLVNARLRTTYKHNPSVTEPQKKNGQVVSTWEYSLELFNTELNFNRHQVIVGRNFYRMGRGLLLANFSDGVEYNGSFKYVQVKGLAIYSGQYKGCTISIGGCATNGDVGQKGVYDIVPGRAADVNVPDPGRRVFVGTQVESPQYFGAKLTALALYSYDLSRDKATTGSNVNKVYAFDPLYLGGGLSGFLITPRLRYLSEFVYELGRTYNKIEKSTDPNVQTNVRAYGFTADVNYSLPFLESLLKPDVLFQYGTGSGRDVKSTANAGDQPNSSNPSQENASGNDNNFYYFGAYSAGLALKPKLSNLHIFRVGMNFRPLYMFYPTRKLMFAVKYTHYTKVRADYGISDDKANLESARVGWALDGQIIWDFRTDLKLFYSFGYFRPGAAYAAKDQSPLQAHLISLNLLF